jgi:hypothetical protein
MGSAEGLSVIRPYREGPAQEGHGLRPGLLRGLEIGAVAVALATATSPCPRGHERSRRVYFLAKRYSPEGSRWISAVTLPSLTSNS